MEAFQFSIQSNALTNMNSREPLCIKVQSCKKRLSPHPDGLCIDAYNKNRHHCNNKARGCVLACNPRSSPQTSTQLATFLCILNFSPVVFAALVPRLFFSVLKILQQLVRLLLLPKNTEKNTACRWKVVGKFDFRHFFFSEFCLFARHVCPQRIELSMDKSSNGQKNLI